MSEPTYRIVRYFQESRRQKVVLQEGVSLATAQDHCKDPESSSKTATKWPGRRRTQEAGPWFDGYEREYDT